MKRKRPFLLEIQLGFKKRGTAFPFSKLAHRMN